MITADSDLLAAKSVSNRVMLRGTFANIRIRNFLAPGTEGGVTRYLGKPGPSSTDRQIGQVMPIYDAAMLYRAAHVPTIILAGAEYGTGSSRDWAAKGTYLLGARAVIATSFERIHRSNLVNMGVLPLEFKSGQTAGSLKLTGRETFDVTGIRNTLTAGGDVIVRATEADGSVKDVPATVRIDTPEELVAYLRSLEEKFPGLEYVHLSNSMGTPQAQMVEQLAWLGKEVLPHFTSR